MNELVERYYECHKLIFENWTHGKPVKSWTDENGNLCIMYEDGEWWHYREKNGELEWW